MACKHLRSHRRKRAQSPTFTMHQSMGTVVAPLTTSSPTWHKSWSGPNLDMKFLLVDLMPRALSAWLPFLFSYKQRGPYLLGTFFYLFLLLWKFSLPLSKVLEAYPSSPNRELQLPHYKSYFSALSFPRPYPHWRLPLKLNFKNYGSGKINHDYEEVCRYVKYHCSTKQSWRAQTPKANRGQKVSTTIATIFAALATTEYITKQYNRENQDTEQVISYHSLRRHNKGH